MLQLLLELVYRNLHKTNTKKLKTFHFLLLSFIVTRLG